MQISFHKENTVWWLVGLFILLSGRLLMSYLNISFSLHNVTLLALPFIISLDKERKGSARFLFLALMLTVFHLITQLTVFLFLSVGFGVFGIIEVLKGRVNFLAILALLLVTPLTKYFFDVFGFPIRLKLSEFTGYVLGLVVNETETLGNNILINGKSYAVDAACMGLKLVITSLLFSLLIISISEKKWGKKYNIKQLALFLSVTLGLIVLNNFLRIILLIITQFPPKTLGHELVGIFSLIGFVFIPLIFLTKKILPKSDHSIVKKHREKSKWSLLLLLPTLLISLSFAPRKDVPLDAELNAIQPLGLNKEVLPNHVLKLSNGWSKTFIKPIQTFFSVTHEPFICWRGTGYSINKERLIDYKGFDICTAELMRAGELIHTAWYFTNHKNVTTNQFEWRFDWLKSSEKYYLVNVSAPSQELLEEALDVSLGLAW